MSNVSKLRASARAAKLGREDGAGVELALLLAGILDRATPPTPARIADGEIPLSLEDRLKIVKDLGPLYLRTLTQLGLTRAGRGAQPNGTIPTVGGPAGSSAERATHDAHRARFSERRAG